VICFEIHINGEPICTAGVGSRGVLSAIVNWVRRRAASCPQGVPKERWCAEELTLDVLGLTKHKNKDHIERLKWLSRPLAVGDEIRIVIVKKRQANAPQNRDKEPALDNDR
jgi:hypothetical protein